MGSFYKVWYVGPIELEGELYEELAVKSQALSDGFQVVSHNKIAVPVTIRGKEATIRVENVLGDLSQVRVPGMGSNLTFKEGIKSVDLYSDAAGLLIQFYGSTDGRIPMVCVEYRNEEPKVTQLGIERLDYDLS